MAHLGVGGGGPPGSPPPPSISVSLSLCPHSTAGAWTDGEAYKIYREKLSRLRDLYMGQLGHLKHVLQEKRREFLLQWQNEGGARLQGTLYSNSMRILVHVI